ncbi:unnamed protein product [Closterium sp. Yama58-4]|nr:unnamed protein product [Closterium sp. Yama58-4]
MGRGGGIGSREGGSRDGEGLDDATGGGGRACTGGDGGGADARGGRSGAALGGAGSVGERRAYDRAAAEAVGAEAVGMRGRTGVHDSVGGSTEAHPRAEGAATAGAGGRWCSSPVAMEWAQPTWERGQSSGGRGEAHGGGADGGEAGWRGAEGGEAEGGGCEAPPAEGGAASEGTHGVGACGEGEGLGRPNAIPPFSHRPSAVHPGPPPAPCPPPYHLCQCVA